MDLSDVIRSSQPGGGRVESHQPLMGKQVGSSRVSPTGGISSIVGCGFVIIAPIF